MPTLEELEKGFQIGEWEVLPNRREFHRGEEVAQPEPKQLKVLLALAQRDGDVVTRDELVEECWDGRPTADEPINRSISQLRRHLGDTERPYQYIDALVKTGYCLKQKVILKEPVETTAAPVIVHSRKRSRSWAAVAGLVVAAVIVWMLIDRPPKPVTSIAVLPFSNLTGDPDNAYVASGFKEELVHTLQGVPELAIKNLQVADENLSATVVGESHGVDSVLIGALRIEGAELKFSYQLVRVEDGVNVSSGQVGGPRDRLFTLQEELAGLVRSHVVGDSSKRLLSQSRPSNPVAYDRYMLGQHLLERRGVAGNLERAIGLFEESIELDPSYGPAYLALAEINVLLPDYRGADTVESHARAISIIERGIDADPAVSNAAAAVYGFVYHKRKQWALAEEAFITATSTTVVESNAFNWYSLMLGSVGRFDEALAQAHHALEINPTSAIINSRIAIIYTWIGDNQRAAEYFDRGSQLGGGNASYLLANALYLYRQGKINDARRLTVAGVTAGGGSTDWVDPVFAALDDPTRIDAALSALDQVAVDEQIQVQVEVTLRTMLGDIDGALRVAEQLVQPGATFETDLLFMHEFAPLRQRPEFLELMAALGVTDYWQQAGCQWKDFAVDCS